MAITSELIEAALNFIEPSELETRAIKSFGYVILYRCKTAELMAVESPDETGRRVFAGIAEEYRHLALYLGRTGQEGCRNSWKGILGRRRTSL